MKKFWLKIRNSVNGIVEHFGVDKLLHFLVGAWLTSIVSPFGMLYVVAMLVFVTVISYVKEVYVDSVFDKKDLIAGVLGSATSTIIALILSLLM